MPRKNISGLMAADSLSESQRCRIQAFAAQGFCAWNYIARIALAVNIYFSKNKIFIKIWQFEKIKNPYFSIGFSTILLIK